jgi:Collagen triple helix repeat (20 copies)
MRIGWKRAAVAVGALALGGAGTALATGGLGIIGADGVIHGCYQTEQGMLRVVPAQRECRASELAIRWNEQGPQGERGLQGERGPVGPEGPVGPQGEPGAKGDTGATGAQGERGEQGEKGEPGLEGLRGETGATGERGPAGPVGPKGDDGVPGLSGYEIVDADSNVSSAQTRSATAVCPNGKRAISGSASAILHSVAGEPFPEYGYLAVTGDNVTLDGRSWFGFATEMGDGTPDVWRIRVRAVCAYVG